MSRIEVAVLGPAGTFTEIAARKAFGDAKLVYCDTVDQVFEAVAAGKDYGVVAIENSLEGSVNTTMDCLIEYDTKIVKEIVLDIGLCLAASQKTKKEDVKIIVSHPHALAQCRRFLSENYPKARLQRHESTAAAMKEAKDAVGYAAVGPKESAQLYGLSVLEDSIADASSQTRFVVIAKEEAKGTSPLIFIIPLVIIVLIIIGIVFFFMTRKKKVEPIPPIKEGGEEIPPGPVTDPVPVQETKLMDDDLIEPQEIAEESVTEPILEGGYEPIPPTWQMSPENNPPQ